MKIAVVGTFTQSNLETFLAEAFSRLGHDVTMFDAWGQKSLLRHARIVNTLTSVPRLRHGVRDDFLRFVNRRAMAFFEKVQPDFVIAHNGGEMLAETVRSVTSSGVPFATFAADDPTIGFYVPDYLPVFSSFTHVFVPESQLVEKLQRLTDGKVVYNSGGSLPDLYCPVDPTEEQKQRFGSPLGYASSAYSGGAYGVYRAVWLSKVKEFGLRIFGDRNWRVVARKVPAIAECVHATGMLSVREMNALYASVAIYVNIVNPQIGSGVAQRVLDAAAAGCFQITEYKADIDRLFPDGEIVTFTTPRDLREKVSYYLDHPEERAAKGAAARRRILSEHTWVQKAEQILETVSAPH